MLVGAHPMQGSVNNSACPYNWVFECWHYDKKTKERCGRMRSIRCNGNQHIMLEEAIKEIERYGWRLAPYGGGWRCLDHLPQNGADHAN